MATTLLGGLVDRLVTRAHLVLPVLEKLDGTTCAPQAADDGSLKVTASVSAFTGVATEATLALVHALLPVGGVASQATLALIHALLPAGGVASETSLAALPGATAPCDPYGVVVVGKTYDPPIRVLSAGAAGGTAVCTLTGSAHTIPIVLAAGEKCGMYQIASVVSWSGSGPDLLGAV